jgi:hypothetical protein
VCALFTMVTNGVEFYDIFSASVRMLTKVVFVLFFDRFSLPPPPRCFNYRLVPPALFLLLI